MVYIIFQTFAFYIAVHDHQAPGKARVFATKLYWLEVVAIYAIQALTQWTQVFAAPTNRAIYESMALVTLFTMMFVALLAALKIRHSDTLA